MGLSNGPSSSAATASVPAAQVGEASGVSNMARYVGAAVATALAATIYAQVTANQQADGASAADALSSGLGAASWLMAVFSLFGVVMVVVFIVQIPSGEGRGTLDDVMAAAASAVHTVPPVARRDAGLRRPRQRGGVTATAHAAPALTGQRRLTAAPRSAASRCRRSAIPGSARTTPPG